jgi:hypothetical protein
MFAFDDRSDSLSLVPRRHHEPRLIESFKDLPSIVALVSRLLLL